MNTLTLNSSNIFANNAVQNIVKFVSMAFFLGTASLAQAGTGVVTVTDNYLYESLIQTEFDIENQMQASVAQSSTETVQEALMAANTVTSEQLLVLVTENAETSKELTE